MPYQAAVRVLGVASLIWALGTGCPADQAHDGQLSACDPVAAQAVPIALGDVVAAGKDADDTLYVAARDPASSEDRVFVSSGDTLYRKRVTGSGSGGASDFTWSFEDGATTRRLVAHKQGDRVTDIALASPDQKTFFAQLDATAEILAPIDPSTLSSFKVRNLPGEITLEYVADVQDGSRIVVTRPRDDWSYDDFRVFYGRGDQLIERVVKQVGRGSFTIIEFVVDGADFKATFTSILAPSITSNLDTGSAMFSITTLDPPTLEPSAMFECLR
jgi:hypothetical protein